MPFLGDNYLRYRVIQAWVFCLWAAMVPGATLLVAWLVDQRFLCSGDITNINTEIRENVGKGLIYRNFLLPEDTGRTFERRNGLKMQDDRFDVRIVVSHDLEDIQNSEIRHF